jgi:hypothetical protein
MKSKRNCSSKHQTIKKKPTAKAYWKETILWNTSPETNLSKQAKLSDVCYEVKEERRKRLNWKTKDRRKEGRVR